jgi:glycosyltransferase involved in cell wall biosynthesis
MLGLADQLLPRARTSFLSFAEGGRCQAFVAEARRQGFEAEALHRDTPWLRSASREIAERLRAAGADLLCCHGYKAGLVGRSAARAAGVPVVAVSRGWTAESLKVRLYEKLDRFNLRWMDRVVCVSHAQAAKVRRAGVYPDRVRVIHNSIDPARFADPDLRCLRELHEMFPSPRRLIVASAGRLSREKGFDLLVEAAARAVKHDNTLGFIHFGDGPQRAAVEKRIRQTGMEDAFLLPGMREDLDVYFPFFDLFVLPSWTEGLPNVVLEAFAARVPVVATAVGGTPEVVEEGVNGWLLSPGDPWLLADRILEALADERVRQERGDHGHRRVCEQFSFKAQARAYTELFAELAPAAMARTSASPCREGSLAS